MSTPFVTSQPPPSEKRSAPREWLAYQELPSVVSQETWDDMGRVQEALRQHALGQFQQAADLVDVMMTDPRIGSKIRERVGALLGLKAELQPAQNRGGKPLAALKADLASMLPSSDLWQVHYWGIWLGFGIARVRWDTRPDRWTPSLEWWHPRHVFWRWDTFAYSVITTEGTVTVQPDDPNWFIYTPYGPRRGWMQGIIRHIAVLWLLKQWTLRDWSRHNEVHGNPIRLAKVPAMADDAEEKDRFLRAVANLGSESVIRIVQGDSDGTSYGLELVEPKSQAYETFGKFKSTLDDDIAIAIVGQTGTTTVSGSYAAAKVHDIVRGDILREDGTALERACNEGPIRAWTEYNFGDRTRAPVLSWPTAPPEDGDAIAKKTRTFLDTVARGTEVGVQLDVPWLAQACGIVLASDEGGTPVVARPIQQWHVSEGVVDPNEVRAQFGMKPRRQQLPPTTPPPTAQKKKPRALSVVLSDVAQSQDAVDAVVDAVVDDAGRVFSEWLGSLTSALSDRPDDSEGAAARWLRATSPAPLQALAEPALLHAWLTGWAGAPGSEALAAPARGVLLHLAKSPHKDAVDYLRQKVPVPEKVWKRLSSDVRRHAFKVAAVSQARMAADVQAKLVRALKEGWTFERFAKESGPGLRRAWAQSRSASAPTTAEAESWRLETIFRTVTQSAYSAGRVKKLREPAMQEAMSFWHFSVVADERKCPTCGALRGLVLPVGHAAWNRLIPPLHFCCRCSIVGLSKAQAKRMGVTSRAPAVRADEGFGEDPTLWRWKPDIKTLPRALRSAAKDRLASMR